MYVTYPEGEQVVSAITSIDVNWPMFDIHQSGLEYGFIDGDLDELFYHSVDNYSINAANAIDLERQEDVLWYVQSDGNLYQYNRATDEEQVFEILADAQFTEVAID
ncbi:hypothetical protein C1E23_03690 [Pseudoalteromonas phenolica]|uniref:Uncharacterized protein n=1 Tax=Pseudoalteromonas phenolica TaxID=161398 RepID=A0A4Q7IRN7_9GAMM|nr:hypothetical protein [Pseudoalteromonas phenolica]RZQ54475.1 hypothetical protein C1E23_03690 [Pseudoalteromonas phenolica]